MKTLAIITEYYTSSNELEPILPLSLASPIQLLVLIFPKSQSLSVRFFLLVRLLMIFLLIAIFALESCWTLN